MQIIVKKPIVRVNLITMESVGNRLKLLREKMGLSQMELSHRSGVSQASIARIEAVQQKNLKSATLEKLASALDVPISHLLEEPLIISEETAHYEAARMIPVITFQRFVESGFRIGSKTKHMDFEPTLSDDPHAVFLTGYSSLGPDVSENDLLLVEPTSRIKDGDAVLFVSKNNYGLGRIYYRSSVCIIQPLIPSAEPIVLPSKKRKSPDVKIFRVAEIRKKM